jgi:hypothetical protein
MEGIRRHPHTTRTCRGRYFANPAQAMAQQNGGHVPTHPAIPAPFPFRARAQADLSVRSCGDLRGLL